MRGVRPSVERRGTGRAQTVTPGAHLAQLSRLLLTPSFEAKSELCAAVQREWLAVRRPVWSEPGGHEKQDQGRRKDFESGHNIETC
jgi:hypothetical protein